MVKKSILVVVPSLSGGGAERVAINLINGLNLENKLKVQALLISRGDRHLMPLWNGLKCSKTELQGNKLLKIVKIFLFVLRNRKDFIFITHMYKINILFCFIAKIVKIKLLCIEHNTFSQKTKCKT